MSDQQLTAKQWAFVREYAKSFDTKKAMRAGGYPADGSGRNGRKLLSKKHIIAAINREIEKGGVSAKPTVDGILKELMRIAFFDPKELFDDRGNPKPLSEIDEDTRRCIAGIEFAVDGRGEDAVTIHKYKVADKHKALENLGRHLAMFTDKIKIDPNKALENMTDDELRTTVRSLAEATGLTLGAATTSETQH